MAKGLKSPKSALGTSAFQTEPDSFSQSVTTSEPLMTACSPGAAAKVMRRPSPRPVRGGLTHSR